MRSGGPTGPLRQWAVPHGVAILAGAALLAALTSTGFTWRLDAWLYDLHLRYWPHEASEDIVLVTIDDHSLSELGRWPWSRRVHAELIERLTEIGVRGVILDLVLAEPDAGDATGDAALVEAIVRNGRVILPVLAEPARRGGLAVEVMPVPAITQAVAALGHTAVAVDDDAVSRGVYLEAGLHSPYWPALGLAPLRLDEPDALDPLPGLTNPHRDKAPPFHWVRDHYVMIPFAAPESFGNISYVDALRDDWALPLLRDRWVIVGVTAQGLGMRLQTPVVGAAPYMSGVAYQANALNMLVRGTAITPLTAPWQFAFGLILIALPVLLHGLPGLRSGTVTAIAAGVLAMAVSVLMLRGSYLWFPPVPVLITVAAGHAVWLFGRLNRFSQQASSDPLTGLANRRQLMFTFERQLGDARRARRSLSLLLIDVDHLKYYNDAYGHRAGDQVLRRLAQVIVSQARRSRDMAARFGGDEFALLLPETAAEGAERAANAILTRVSALNLGDTGLPATNPRRLGVSIGVHTDIPGRDTTIGDFFDAADQALYRAKHEGRNSFVVS